MKLLPHMRDSVIFSQTFHNSCSRVLCDLQFIKKFLYLHHKEEHFHSQDVALRVHELHTFLILEVKLMIVPNSVFIIIPRSVASRGIILIFFFYYYYYYYYYSSAQEKCNCFITIWVTTFKSLSHVNCLCALLPENFRDQFS